MTVEQILLALLALPLLGAVVVWTLGPERGEAVRAVSTGVSLIVLLLAGLLAWQFLARDHPPPTVEAGKPVPTFKPVFVPGADPDDQHRTTWNVLPIGSGAIQFYLGIDGLNIWL